MQGKSSKRSSGTPLLVYLDTDVIGIIKKQPKGKRTQHINSLLRKALELDDSTSRLDEISKRLDKIESMLKMNN